MITAIVGINWGTKARPHGGLAILRLRYHMSLPGGNNAGHTVINDKGKFILNLLPSVLRDNTVNVRGMVIDLEPLWRDFCPAIQGCENNARDTQNQR